MKRFLLGLATALTLVSSFAMAQQPPATPLVVIRLKDKPVSYEAAVAKAVRRALDIKADTLFTIRTVTSKSASSQARKQVEAEAGALAHYLQEKGVSAEHVRIEPGAPLETPESGIQVKELQLFVE